VFAASRPDYSREVNIGAYGHQTDWEPF